MLAELCGRLGVPFSDSMLAWAPGPRATDGVWAEHWYEAVERSTGFGPPPPDAPPPPPEMRPLHAECLEYYRRLHEHRIRI